MRKTILFLLTICLVSQQEINAQNRKLTINRFFAKEFGEKVSFEIGLPYKVKISSHTIKRSNSPGFQVYNLKPVKQKNGVSFSISQSLDSIRNCLQVLEYAGGDIESVIEGKTYLLKFRENSNSSNYYAVMLKQIYIGKKIHCLSLYVAGAYNLLDNELPQLLNSFHESKIYLEHDKDFRSGCAKEVPHE